MKQNLFTLAALPSLWILCFFALLQGCGYQSPYSLQKTEKPFLVYHGLWKNRTDEFGAESLFFNTMNDWLQRSRQIRRVNHIEKAEYILEGEIIRASHPGLTYGRNDNVREMSGTITFAVSFVHRESGKILFRENELILTMPYHRGVDAIRTRDAKKESLLRMADDLAEHVYLLILDHALKT